MKMTIAQTLSRLDWIARRLNLKDVIGLLDDVDRYGRMYAARVVIVGGALEDRQTLARELAGRELDREWAAWGEYGVSIDARAGIGAEIVIGLNEQTHTYELLSGLFLMRSGFKSVEELGSTVSEGFARRVELQAAALRKVAVWCLREVESKQFHPPTPSPTAFPARAVAATERGSQATEIETEITYLINRVQDDFGSLRYRQATVESLESFNAAVTTWLSSEKAMIGAQLSGLIERTTRDLQRIGNTTDRLPKVPELTGSAPELTTKPVPPDDRVRTAVSLGGGGLIAVVSQVLLSQGPVAALATGAVAGVAAYVALGQKKGESADPVVAYFELMQRTTIDDLKRHIEGVGAALTNTVTPVETVIESQEDEIGSVLAEVREALENVWPT